MTVPRWWTVPAFAVAAGGLGAWVVPLKATNGSHPLVDTVLGGLAGLLFLVAGSVAHLRRPHNRVGLLMVLVAAGWFAEDLRFSESAAVCTLGLLLAHASSGFLAHLVLAFPTGDLTCSDRRVAAFQRITVVAAYLVALGLAAVAVPFFDPASHRVDYPANLLLLHDDPRLVRWVVRAVEITGVVVAAAVLGLLLRRWLRATRPMRRVLVPVFGTGLVGAGASVVGNLTGYAEPLDDIGLLVYKVVFCLLPLAFLAGVLRLRLGRTPVEALLTQLNRPQSPEVLEHLVARALGDPSLRIGYWQPEHRRFTDGDQRTLVLPAPQAHRTVTDVETGGRRVAVLIHDPALVEDRGLLDSVRAATALAVANIRLAAEQRQGLADARAARAAAIAASDAASRRLERDLHDGAQQRLILAALSLREAHELLGETVRSDVTELLTTSIRSLEIAVDELRDLARGIRPAVLDAGLGPAVETLAQRLPLAVDLRLSGVPRLPPPVEAAAFFTVAEALTNTVKHSGASRVRIRLRCSGPFLRVSVADNGSGSVTQTGTGIAGLRDRVTALAGQFTVRAIAGGGTAVVAVLPCSGVAVMEG